MIETDKEIPSTCNGCKVKPGVNEKNWCINIYDNDTGNCPCTNCLVKTSCSEVCLTWYDWAETV